MPLIEPSFTIPRSIPLIGGEWGPFVNPSLRKGEQKQLFILFIASLFLILVFGSLSYYSSKKAFESPKVPEDPEPLPEEFSLHYFLGIGKLLDVNSLMVGMGAGIVFGLIDNGGLWFGMDSLDAVLEPRNVPWVYGNGGRRAYSGLTHDGDSVYYGVEFKDGILERGDKIGGRDPHEICKKIQSDYDRVNSAINRKEQSKYDSFKQRESIKTNEAAFSDPNSPMFIGSNMTKNDFFKKFVQFDIGESMYTSKIDNYRNYLNTDTPKKRQKQKLKRQLKGLETLKRNNTGRPTQKYNDKVDGLKKQIRQQRMWPGKNKKMAQAWMGGYSAGKLTQAGIGNTYSDFLGSFLATFVGVIILNMTNISNVSILSEVVGIVIGCLIGIFIPRMISIKT